jgi:hypothetical protein
VIGILKHAQITGMIGQRRDLCLWQAASGKSMRRAQFVLRRSKRIGRDGWPLPTGSMVSRWLLSSS